jgi:nitrite reductase (NO-forming)
MRDTVFAVLIVVAIVIGLAALFEHRPGVDTVAPVNRRPSNPQRSSRRAGPRRKPLRRYRPLRSPLQAAALRGTHKKTRRGRPTPRHRCRRPLAARSLPPRPASTLRAPMAGMMQHAAMQETSSAGDPMVGQKVFRKCRACHSLDPGRNMIGPSLGGIIGRKPGASRASLIRRR